MSDPTPNGRDLNGGELSDALRAAGESVPIHAADPADIHRRVRRRTNRRRAAIGGVCAVGLVVGVGAIVTNDGGDGDLVRSADPELGDETSDGESEGDVVVVPAPTTTAAPGAAGATTAATGVGDDAAAIEMFAGAAWLVPWQDGFLKGGYHHVPAPMPALDELPTEVVELFPQEVRDLFAENPAATVDEAMAMLDEAGLFETVIEIMEANPDAGEALYGEPTQPNYRFTFSTDGQEWEPIEVALPDAIGDISQLTVVDGRLVAVGVAWNDGLDQMESPGPTSVVVASTTDLAEWTTQTLTTGASADLPDIARVHRWPSAIAARADRWMVAVETHFDIDPEPLLPDDMRELLHRYGWGMSTDDVGVTIEISDHCDEMAFDEMMFEEPADEMAAEEPADAPPATMPVPIGGPAGECDDDFEAESHRFDFTWGELGIPAEMVDQFVGGMGGARTAWTATWDGEPTAVDLPDGEHYGPGPVVAVGAGFATFGQPVMYSADGAGWAPMAGAPSDLWVNGTMAVDGGTVFFGGGPDGPQTYLVGDDLSWTPIEIPGLPANGSVQGPDSGSRGAAIVDATVHLSPEFDVSFEGDGVTLHIHEGGEGQSYELVDDATGEVLVAESYRYDDRTAWEDESGPYEYWTWDETGITIIAPDDGRVLITVSHEEHSKIFEEAYRDLEDSGEFFEPTPDLWVIASSDGHDWFVQQLEPPTGPGGEEYEDYGWWPHMVVANDSVVLVGDGMTWQHFDR